jgi:hypothetical protein
VITDPAVAHLAVAMAVSTFETSPTIERPMFRLLFVLVYFYVLIRALSNSPPAK